MARRNLMNGGAVPMESGERDRVVTIQQLAETVATSKFPSENWTTLKAGVFMRKIDAKQYERVKGDQIAAAFDTQWEMPYLTSMDPEIVDVAPGEPDVPVTCCDSASNAMSDKAARIGNTPTQMTFRMIPPPCLLGHRERNVITDRCPG